MAEGGIELGDGQVYKFISMLQFAIDNYTLVGALLVGLVVAVVARWLFKPHSASHRNKVFLDPKEFQPLTLVRKQQITHNTVRLRFDLPDSSMRLGLPIGQHITWFFKDTDGSDVYRPYTPTSDDDMRGAVEFVIKLYPQGKMSQHIAKLSTGAQVLMKGPRGRFQYAPNMKKHIGMLAGGSGITPMYQVLHAIVKNQLDKTKVSLVFANLTEEDILLREELDGLAVSHPNRFSVHYVLNTAPPTWQGSTGFITQDIIKQHIAPPGEDVLVLRCGPNPMMEAMAKHLEALGYSAEQQFQF